MPSVYCTQCGHANPEDARFCSRCGSPLTRPEVSGDTTSTISVAGIEAYEAETGDMLLAERQLVEQLPPGAALLTVTRGPNQGSRFR
ncbi:MAG TPA: zinc-ribbon domain-containing protein, partial [Nonomuraea sp.]|nr:zinc-ribbon domain-containing protein [Nonomuraea sp.]